MRNVWIICRKELRSYFVSPVAYLLLAMFTFIFGWFFWNMVNGFVRWSMASQMRGQMSPVNINEELIRPLISNIAVIGLFFIPIITMRLFAEEKRTGTIELLATSPIRDLEIIIGKWLAALLLYAGMLLLTGLNLLWLFKYGTPDWKPLLVTYLGFLLQVAALLAIGTFISTLTPQPSVSVSCSGCSNGPAAMNQPPGRASLLTSPSSRTSKPSPGASSPPKTQSSTSA